MITQIVLELRDFQNTKFCGSCSLSALVGRLLATHVVTKTTSTNTVLPDDDEG